MEHTHGHAAWIEGSPLHGLCPLVPLGMCVGCGNQYFIYIYILSPLFFLKHIISPSDCKQTAHQKYSMTNGILLHNDFSIQHEFPVYSYDNFICRRHVIFPSVVWLIATAGGSVSTKLYCSGGRRRCGSGGDPLQGYRQGPLIH
jgi:hypothetical protein